MELLWLRYFETAARLESMTRAAEAHMIPQPAMSQTIARLEAELGVKLFTREKQRIYLNDNGRRFLSYARTAIDSIDEGIKLFEKKEKEPELGRLRVLQNRDFVHACVYSFSELHPEVSFDVQYGASDDRRFDVCFADGKTAEQYDYSDFLFDEEILLGVPKDSPLVKRESVRLLDALEYPWIFISEHFPLADLIEGVLAHSPKRPPATIRCQDPHMVRQSVRAGLGVSFMSKTHQNGAYDGIALLKLVDLQLRRATYLCHNGKLSDVAEEFRTFVLRQAEE